MVLALASLCFAFLQILSGDYYFITREGFDHPQCGATQNDACGTLYYASELMNNRADIIVSDTIIFSVIDGQNKTQINQYANDKPAIQYHPCLPIPLTHISFDLTFDFNSSNIQKMTDWYPPICSIFDGKVINNYMFEINTGNDVSFQRILFNNLIVDNFPFNTVLSAILYTSTGYDVWIKHCIVSNLFVEYGTTNSLSFFNAYTFFIQYSEFYNITTYGYDNFINGEDVHLNIITAQYMFLDNNFVESPTIRCNTCYFNTIHVGEYSFLFHSVDGSISGGARIIENSKILNFNQGSILYFESKYFEGNAAITDSIISMNQTNYFGLFQFVGLPEGAVMFERCNITYYYDLYSNCHVTHIHAIQYGTVIDVSCYSPWEIIQVTSTQGLTLMHTDMSVIYIDDVNNVVTLDEYREFIAKQYNFTVNEIKNQTVVITFGYTVNNGIISVDYGQILIQNLTINSNLFGNTFFYLRWIHNFTIDHLIVKNYGYGFNPNDLHCTVAILLLVVQSIIIKNSEIFNVKQYILYNFMSTDLYIDIENSSFHHSLMAIKAEIDNINIVSSSFYALGNYYTDITFYEQNNSWPSPISLEYRYYSLNSICFVNISDSSFLYYSVTGLMNMEPIKWLNKNYQVHINMERNIIGAVNSNESIWYMHIPLNMQFYENISGIVQLGSLENCNRRMHFVNNYFKINEINDSIPMIHIEKSNGTETYVCLTGNVFYNYAMYLGSVCLTSCFRPYLYKNVFDENYNSCDDVSYGILNEYLVEYTNLFITTENYNNTIIKLINSTMTLDNAIFNSTHVKTDKNFIINIDNQSNLILIDSIITDPMSYIKYNSELCQIVCNQRYIHNPNEIVQLSILCLHKMNVSNSLSSIKTNYVDHLSPLQIDLLGLVNYFAGEQLIISYIITDKYDNCVLYNEFSDNINILIKNANLNMIQSLIFSKSQGCITCDTGIYIGDIIIGDIGKSYLLDIVEENNILFTKNRTIIVSECPSGYGVNSASTQCLKCSEGYFNINSSNTEQCHSCQHNEGINCKGGNKIMINQHYWMTITDSDSRIISSVCVFGQCCTLQNGCNFITNKSSLCAEHRNSSTTMCSECNIGYSELFLSLACGYCDKTYYLWLLFSFTLAFGWIVYILLSKSTSLSRLKSSELILLREPPSSCCNKCHKCSNCTNCRCRDKCDLLNAHIQSQLKKYEYLVTMTQMMFMKCIIYYQQSLSQIFLNSNVHINLVTFSSVFNLSIDSLNTSSKGGFCFIKNMTAKQEILSGFIVIAFIMILLTFFYMTYKYIYQFSTLLCHRKPHFGRTFIAILLLCVGQILSILFKLIACQQINSTYVHLFFAYDQCFDGVWFLALFGIIGIIVLFSILLVSLIKMNKDKRQNDQNILRPLTASFKPQQYYWEIVILMRRIFIAFLSISFGNDNIYAKFSLIVLICIFAHIQSIYQPFLINQANYMEDVLLKCTVILILIETVHDKFDDLFTYSLIAILIFSPFVLLFYYVCIVIRYRQSKQRIDAMYISDKHVNNIGSSSDVNLNSLLIVKATD